MTTGERKTGGHGAKRGRREEAAIAALLLLPTIKAAAKHAAISEATLRRWMADPGFAEAYRAERRAALERATGQLQAAAVDAAVVLRLVARDVAAPAAARVTAASRILELAYRASELEDFEGRITELEQSITESRATARQWRAG